MWKFDVPLAQATTSSLQALKAYSLANRANHENGSPSALSYHQRAIELDPNFAMGYEKIGEDYFGLGELGRAREYYSKAFELQAHVSEREKLVITAAYYSNVTGELDKAARTYQEWIENYPRDSGPRHNLGNVYAMQGQWEKASQAYGESLRLSPNSGAHYSSLANSLLALQRFEEGRRIIYEAKARKLDDFIDHNALYALAFVGADSSTMTEEQQWFAGQSDLENDGLTLASDTEAYAGHLGKARELTKQSVDSAIRADSKENGAIWLENAALREAAFGNAAKAKQAAGEGLKLAPNSQGVEDEAALAFAMVGDAPRAESIAKGLNKSFPVDSQLQSLWLAAIQGQLALDRGIRRTPSILCKPVPGWNWVKSCSSTISPVFSRPTLGKGISVRGTRQCRRRRISKDHRPQRDRLELLDGSVSAFGRGSCKCFAGENFAGRGGRCRPRPSAGRLQRFPHALGRCRPRHPDPEGSQSGVRKAAIAEKSRLVACCLAEQH